MASNQQLNVVVINPITNISSLSSGEYDALVIIATNLDEVRQNIDDELVISTLQSYKEFNNNFDKEITLIINGNERFKWIIYSPTGLTKQDYDDVRRFADAGLAGVKKAKTVGAKSPLIACFASEQYPKAKLVTLLGALEATYIPLQVREHTPEAQNKVDRLGFLVDRALLNDDNLIAYARANELGRVVGRDIGGADPERMTPPRVAEYVQALFTGSSNVTVNIIEGQERFEEEFPLFAAVNRAANTVARHQGCIIKLEYKPSEDEIDKTLLFVGKGITYDTGGLDIKTGGSMVSMSYDKCGAANVAGFFKVLSELKPRRLKAIAMLAVARNSCGEEGYVSDEILTTRARIRIRVGNTDAEGLFDGRMVMADPLCYLRELAVDEINPHLFIMATLTGHVVRAYGENYTAIIDNGPAREQCTAQKLQEVGEKVGDPFEISTVRREDFDFILDKGEVAEVLQCNQKASSDTSRGHQFPAAFLAKASGLDKHGIHSEKPLPYTHFDIAGSAGELPHSPTGRPIAALCEMFLAGRIP